MINILIHNEYDVINKGHQVKGVPVLRKLDDDEDDDYGGAQDNDGDDDDDDLTHDTDDFFAGHTCGGFCTCEISTRPFGKTSIS